MIANAMRWFGTARIVRFEATFAVCFLVALAPAMAEDTLYVADIFNPIFSNGYLRTMDTDGSGLQTLVNTGDGIRGIAVDPYVGKIYWADVDADVIRRANLDGSGVEDIITNGLAFPMAVDLDLVHGKLYWGDQSLDQIGWANLDGSEAAPLITTHFASGLAVDPLNGKIYWSRNLNVSPWNQADILRADLDGANVETVVTGAGKPADLALDVAGGHVYWTDYTFDVVRRAGLDGSAVEDIFVVGANLDPQGIALDLSAGKVYWGQEISTTPHIDQIRRMDLDGGNPEMLADGLGLATDLAFPSKQPGDVDGDGDIDADDVGAFVGCLAGPNVPYALGCASSDLDADGDVDPADFARFSFFYAGV